MYGRRPDLLLLIGGGSMSSMENRKRQTKHLTVSAMLCALGVILLMLGSFVEVIDASVAVIASLLCVYAVIEIGGMYPWLIWAVTSVIGVLLIPQKTPALFYALFAGYYPMLKEILERKFRPQIAIPLKLAAFHVSLALMYGVLRLFLPAQLEGLVIGWMLLALYVAAVAVFLIYDYALTKLISGYLFKWRKYFRLK